MRPIKRRQPACSPHDIRASLCCWAFLISGRLTGASGVLQFGINATCLAGISTPSRPKSACMLAPCEVPVYIPDLIILAAAYVESKIA